jgi:hypothetical protein
MLRNGLGLRDGKFYGDDGLRELSAVRAAIDRARAFENLVKPDGSPARDNDRKIRGRPGSWTWANPGDAVEKLRVIPFYPAAVVLFTATPTSNVRIVLTWRVLSTLRHTGLELQKRLSGTAEWAFVTDLAAGTETYEDVSNDSATSYDFRIRVFSATEDGDQWVETSATTLVEPPLIAPSGCSVEATGSTGCVVTWDDNDVSEDGYEVWRSTDGIIFTLVGDVSANTETYTDNTCSAGTLYYYKVRGTLGASVSSFSNTDSAVTLAVINPLHLVFDNAIDIGSGERRLTNDGTASSGSIYTVTGGTFRLLVNNDISVQASVKFTDPGTNGHALGDSYVIGMSPQQTHQSTTQVDNLSAMGDGFVGAEIAYNGGSPRIRFGYKQLRYSGPVVLGGWVSVPTAFDGNFHNVRVSWDYAAKKIYVYFDNVKIISEDLDYQAHIMTYGSYTNVGLVLGCASIEYYLYVAGSTTIAKEFLYAGVQ